MRAVLVVGALLLAWHVLTPGEAAAQSGVAAPSFVRAWGGPGSGGGQFNAPQGITAGPGETVSVADTRNNRVQQFTTRGEFVRTWGSAGSGVGQFNGPVGLASSGTTLYVADSGNDRIQQFSGTGSFQRAFGASGSGNGQLDGPHGIAVEGTLIIVADRNNNRVVQFTSDAGFIRVVGGQGTDVGQFSGPNGVASDGFGDFYVVDAGNSRIQVPFFIGTTLFAFRQSFGSFGSGNGQFRGATGIASGGDNTVYVADTANNRIVQFTLDGSFIRAWGGPGPLNGQFKEPSAVAVGADGSIFVADTGNNRIQQFEDRPVISTIFDQRVAENFTLGPLAFTVQDPPVGTGDALTVTATSNNPSLLPRAAIVLGGSGQNRTMTLTPTPGQAGTATVTLTATNGRKQGTSSFVLTVGGVNDPPTISAILDQSTSGGTPTAPIQFTIGDPETQPGGLTVRASSSDQGLVPDANLALGGSGAERTLTITPAAGRAGTANITVTVSDGTLAASTSFRLTVAAADADLATSLVIVPSSAVVGGPLTYAVTVANLGPADAAGVTATVSWPPLVRFGSAAPSQGTCTPSTGQVSCALGSLAQGATATIAIATTGVAPGAVPTTARVTSATPDPNGANNLTTTSATVVTAPPGPPPPSADLGLAIADSPDPVTVGSPVQYTLTASNAGPAAASGVTLVAGLPSTATIGATEASQGSCSRSGSTLTCLLGTLTSGAQATVRVTVVPSAAGVIAVTAGIIGAETDPALANNTAAETTAVNGPTGPSSPPPPGEPPAGGSRCAPRPTNQVAVVRDGPERLRVTIAAGTLPATPVNALREVRFGAAQNALIDVVGGPTGSAGSFALRPTDGTVLTFFVRRASPGGAATVPLVLIDDCGEYKTFVGGGTGAF